MRDEERRYDEASQLCRAAEDLSERLESLRRRLRERPVGDDGSASEDVERALESARETLGHLRRYREKLLGGAADGVGGPGETADEAAEELPAR